MQFSAHWRRSRVRGGIAAYREPLAQGPPPPPRTQPPHYSSQLRAWTLQMLDERTGIPRPDWRRRFRQFANPKMPIPSRTSRYLQVSPLGVALQALAEALKTQLHGRSSAGYKDALPQPRLLTLDRWATPCTNCGTRAADALRAHWRRLTVARAGQAGREALATTPVDTTNRAAS